MQSNPALEAPGTRQRTEHPGRRCTVAFWMGRRRVFAWSLTLALVVLTVAQAAVPVALNLWSQRLFDALEQRDFSNMLHEAGVAVLIILGDRRLFSRAAPVLRPHASGRTRPPTERLRASSMDADAR